MNTNDTINAAHTIAIRVLESNHFVSPDDTVCAIRTRSGRVFTGVSRPNAPGVMGVHAEVEAVQSMLDAGESIIDELVLIATQTRMQMLPCNNCIGYILSLHPENANCVLLMPDRMIRITDVGMFASNPGAVPEPPMMRGGNNGPVIMGNGFNRAPAQPVTPPPVTPPPVNQPAAPPHPANPLPKAQPQPAAQQVDDEDEEEVVTATSNNSSSDLLKNRVNSLLRAASDDDEEIERITSKKKRFGFFNK